MSFTGGTGLRTIWVALRAANYSGQAFAQIGNDIQKITGYTGNLGKEFGNLKKTMLPFFQTGLMFSTLSYQLGMGIFNLAMSSRAGAGDMARLRQELFLTQQTIANTVYEFLKTSNALETIRSILNFIKNNKGIITVAMHLTIAVSAVLALMGALMFLRAGFSATSWAIEKLGLSLSVSKGQMYAVTASSNMMTISLMRLAAIAGIAVGTFSMFYMLASNITGPLRTLVGVLGAVTAALVAFSIAKALATGSISAMESSIGALQVAALAGSLGLAFGGFTPENSYATGVTSVPRDMIARVHKGETIYNANTNRPLQVGNEIRESSFSKLIDLNTKMLSTLDKNRLPNVIVQAYSGKNTLNPSVIPNNTYGMSRIRNNNAINNMNNLQGIPRISNANRNNITPIYNDSPRKSSSYERDNGQSKIGTSNNYNFNMSIQNLNTKADTDNLYSEFNKNLRRAIVSVK